MEKGQEVVNPDVSAYACNYDLCCFVPRSPLPPSTLLRRLPLLVIQEGSNVWLCAVKVIWVDEDLDGSVVYRHVSQVSASLSVGYLHQDFLKTELVDIHKTGNVAKHAHIHTDTVYAYIYIYIYICVCVCICMYVYILVLSND